MRLERRFETLSVPSRLRLGLGTSQVVKTARWEAKRHKLRVHVTELLEALESIEPIGGVTTQQPAGSHAEYGDLVRLTGLTSTGRAITLVAQAARLPLALVEIEADPAWNAAPPAPPASHSAKPSASVAPRLPCRRSSHAATPIRSPTRASGRCSSATVGSPA